jgi:hypothetical protein
LAWKGRDRYGSVWQESDRSGTARKGLAGRGRERRDEDGHGMVGLSWTWCGALECGVIWFGLAWYANKKRREDEKVRGIIESGRW